jgi:hypothetical protein
MNIGEVDRIPKQKQLDVLFANYEENYGISFIWIIEDISI